jgi:hypothetical protein
MSLFSLIVLFEKIAIIIEKIFMGMSPMKIRRINECNECNYNGL